MDKPNCFGNRKSSPKCRACPFSVPCRSVKPSASASLPKKRGRPRKEEMIPVTPDPMELEIKTEENEEDLI